MTDQRAQTIFAFPRPYAEADSLFAAVADRPWSLFLDSADRAHPLGRYSFIACDPVGRITARDGIVTVEGDEPWQGPADPFAVLRDRLSRHGMTQAVTAEGLPPFQGGAAGYFGYDLARGIEVLPARARPSAVIPDMATGLYDTVAAFDHAEEKSWIFAIAPDARAAEEKRARLETSLAAAPRASASPPGENPPLPWRAIMDRATYESDIATVIDYIRAGDIFQANLSQRFEAATPPGFDAYAHYMTMRRVNAAPFAGYMNFGTVRLSSASPERFLSLRGRRAETRPIKGTSRRDPDPARDRQAREWLAASIKDRAENTMIVDLLRNDLSRVCTDDSVDVPQLCGLESFAAVHHLVSVVTGELRPGEDAPGLLRAAFPGGSITGAPKIRAMEIIEELESERRGPYCGAMGYIGAGGAMDTNIAIRTLVYEGDRIWFNTGGGITADSDPAAEYQETLDKAAGIFRSFGAMGDMEDIKETATNPRQAGMAS